MEIDMVRGAVVCEDDEEVKKPFWETTLGTILDIAMCSVVVNTIYCVRFGADFRLLEIDAI